VTRNDYALLVTVYHLPVCEKTHKQCKKINKRMD